MLASVDAGSNTLRLLIGSVTQGRVVPEFYARRICRLAGGFSAEQGLSPEARERTLSALHEFAATCRDYGVSRIRAAGTAAFRQALNGRDFAARIRAETALPLEILSGDQEATCMARGVLSALEPIPAQSLIIDIGGGSTEFVLCRRQDVVWATSLPLGVVRLMEGCTADTEREAAISRLLVEMLGQLDTARRAASLDRTPLALVGTAGSVTTLAALDMQMTSYDWRRVNNYPLSLERLLFWHERLSPLSALEREQLPGMEAGRGDLIIAGLEILLRLMQLTASDRLTVSDFGILEGLLLSMEGDG